MTKGYVGVYDSAYAGRDDLLINVLELLGMVVTAWAFVLHAGAEPEYDHESIIMRGDNQSPIH